MGEIGLKPAIETANLADHAQQIARIKAAAPPVERMERKTFGFDGRAMAVDMGGDVHLVSRIARGAGHRQAMRDEIPIFGDQVDQARRAQMPRPRFRARGGRCRKLQLLEFRHRADDVIEARCPRRFAD